MAEYKYIVDAGTIIPDTEIVLTQVQDEYKAIFGADLNVSPSTVQGMLINAETVGRIGTLANNSQLANQINPDLAGGVFLDAIMAFLGSARDPEAFSTVPADLNGQPGTPIPSGSQAQNNATGTLWQLVSNVTLDGSGYASGIFQSVVAGEVTANIGTLTIVDTGVLGWETVNNTVAATLGSATQSDAQARNFRKLTLASNSTSTDEAIISAVKKVNGVVSMSFRENDAATTEVIDGVSMPPNSIYACVDGGTDFDVATALVSKKSGGSAYAPGISNPVSELITAAFSGQVFTVLFDRPAIIPIYCIVTASANAAIQDPAAIIRDAIVGYSNGLLTGEPGLTVGTNVSPFEFSGAINRTEPTIYVSNIEISIDGLSYSGSTLLVEIFQLATITESLIQVILT